MSDRKTWIVRELGTLRGRWERLIESDQCQRCGYPMDPPSKAFVTDEELGPYCSLACATDDLVNAMKGVR